LQYYKIFIQILDSVYVLAPIGHMSTSRV